VEYPSAVDRRIWHCRELSSGSKLEPWLKMNGCILDVTENIGGGGKTDAERGG